MVDDEIDVRTGDEDDDIHVHRSIKLYPPASKPRWVLGRDKVVLVVEGREKLAAS